MKNQIAEALATEENKANPGTGTEKGSETETDIVLPVHDTNAATVSAARGAKDTAAREASVAMKNASVATVRGVVASGSTKTAAIAVSVNGARGIVATVIAETEIATMRGMRGTVATVIAAVRDALDGTIAIVTADMAAGDQAGAAAPLATCRP